MLTANRGACVRGADGPVLRGCGQARALAVIGRRAVGVCGECPTG